MLECEREFLEAFGYTVQTASSGSVGLELASVHPADIVILNITAIAHSRGHERIPPVVYDA
jgi:DNA-binding response OmpR family regulator